MKNIMIETLAGLA